MNRILLFAILIILTGCQPTVVGPEEVELKGGLTYLKKSGYLYSGTVIETYPDGNTRYEKHFVEGLPDGIYTRYYHNGKKSSEVVFDNGKTGGYTLWFEDGTVQAVKTDSAGFQKIVRYHSNGQKKMEQSFVNGAISQGAAYSWFDNGQMETESWFDKGKLDGKFNSWYRNGILQITGQYIEGEMDGEWNMFYEDGAVTSQEFYKNGKRVGIWKYFYESGKPKAEIEYRDFIVFGKTEWSEEGRVTDRITRE